MIMLVIVIDGHWHRFSRFIVFECRITILLLLRALLLVRTVAFALLCLLLVLLWSAVNAGDRDQRGLRVKTDWLCDGMKSGPGTLLFLQITREEEDRLVSSRSVPILISCMFRQSIDPINHHIPSAGGGDEGATNKSDKETNWPVHPIARWNHFNLIN